MFYLFEKKIHSKNIVPENFINKLKKKLLGLYNMIYNIINLFYYFNRTTK